MRRGKGTRRYPRSGVACVTRRGDDPRTGCPCGFEERPCPQSSSGRRGTSCSRTARTTRRRTRSSGWPVLTGFNWALDWFDVRSPRTTTAPRCGSWRRTAPRPGTPSREMSARSDQVANWLRRQGVRRGDRIILMLGNQVELWETVLAAMKLRRGRDPGHPAARPRRPAGPGRRAAGARHVVVRVRGHRQVRRGARATTPGSRSAAPVGRAGCTTRTPTRQPATFTPDGSTRRDDTLMLYFTSGTTAQPKLVEHTHASYPVGHLATMYWIGLRPGDVHLNISSPGWAKHAWSQPLRAVERRGDASSSTTTRGSTPTGCWPRWTAAASPASAPRRRCGGC